MDFPRNFAWAHKYCDDSVCKKPVYVMMGQCQDLWTGFTMQRCATYLSTVGSDGSTDLDLSRRFPEFLGVFAPSSTPF